LILKEVFVKLNTSLPASAAGEHLFSRAGLTLNGRLMSMIDEILANLVLLKKNILK